MIRMRFALLVLLALATVPLHLAAQDKPNSEAKLSDATLKLQVTIVEREGEKKVTNLPYTFFLQAGQSGPSSPWTKLRTGAKVPVYTGKDAMQYIDVGTSIDARGLREEDGRFDITLNLVRSWVAGELDIPEDKSAGAAIDMNSGHFKQPVIREFKTEVTLPMHDGQTSEITQAADPSSGRVLTLTVSMSVVK